MNNRAKHEAITDNLLRRRIPALLLAFLFAVSLVAPDHHSDFSQAVVKAAPADDGGLSNHIIDTVSPNHVKFNLFDYWVNTRDSSYSNGWEVQKGINQGHVFLFGAGQGLGPWNVWTGNERHYNNNANRTSGVRYGEYQGVVNNILADGYPILTLEDDVADPLKGRPEFIDNYGLGSKLTESLAYLFDPDIANDYKVSYENVQGLVKYDGNGGYIYNSHENYAAFLASEPGTLGTNGEASDGYFEVYDSWAVPSGGLTSPNGQFFPFDEASEVFQTDSSGNYMVDAGTGTLVPKSNVPLETGTTLNHYIGMTMETVFLQPEDGRIDANTPMYFTFSGDDDVWIFIDGVLVSDLGGIHDECFTIIDFETGTVYTGLTPMIRNDGGTFSEDIPTLEELKSAEAGTSTQTEWTWCDKAADGQPNITGTYADFKTAHGIQSTTLRAIFEAAEQEDYQSWGDGMEMSADTFDQNTQHELKMFYLERGAGASNLVLSFNMLAVPASGVTKTDQDGNPVSGVEFELWPAQVSDTEKDENGNAAPLIDPETGLYIADISAGEPICSAVTDENGRLSFVTDTRKIISFQERAQDGSDPQFYYVLKETGRPAGYRSKGDISLYYSIYNKNTKEGVLLSYNYWQTGAYTQALLDVTMTSELYAYSTDADGSPVAGERIAPSDTATEDEIQEYLDNGIIFAVPIKRMNMSGSLYDDANFNALYGTTNTGWTLMTESIANKTTVLEAAQKMVLVMQQTRQTGTIIAERNARQLFQVTITNIPGDVKLSYPYLMGTERENESEYNIAFYFAPNATSLDSITDASSIVRIATSYTNGGDTIRFDRQYASQFYIPNMFNRVRVQKLNYYGERLAGAEFTMFQTYSYQDRDGNGTQYIWDAGREMYRNTAVVNEDGSLKTREEILSTKAWDTGTTRAEGATGTPGALDLDGTLVFPSKFDDYLHESASAEYQVNINDTSTYMEEGEYVIFETKAPAGYEVNETPITVTVNDDGVFADAGAINDGVRVGQFPGYISNALTTFASEGAVNESLTFIDTTLKVFGADGTLQSPIEGDITWMYKYSNENNRYIFFAEDVGSYVTAGRNLFQFTDEGTPALIVTQSSDVKAKAILFDGDYKGYTGAVMVNKRNADGSVFSLQSMATNGTLGFWLRKAAAGADGQTLDSVYIGETKLLEGTDYHVYEPTVSDLSGYENLSGLLSVETLVQVYDQGYGSLSVTKKTENTPDGSAAQNEIFHFRVYSVFENATKLVLTKTDASGSPLFDGKTGTPVTVDFTGTLNVRLRQTLASAQPDQDTVTNIAVDFQNGVGMFYLQPDYEVEYVYIPENRSHAIFSGLTADESVVGLVETRVTLSDSSQNGDGTVCAVHVAFREMTHAHTVTFTDGAGTFYRNPDYAIQSVKFANGATYKVDAAEGENGLTATSRIQYTTLANILNVPVQGEVDVAFTEADNTPSPNNRVVTNAAFPPSNGDFGSIEVNDGDVTVYADADSGGYKIAYSLASDTYKDASVAQFALYSGQTITIEGFPAGATYYVYEYAVGDGSRDLSDWNTVITADAAGEDLLPEYGYRAAKGTILLNGGTQSVIFTNSAHVGQLTVSKTVSGDQATEADREKEFSFTVTIKDSDGKPLAGTYAYKGGAADGAAAPADGTLTLTDGSAVFTLKHGQSITIGEIPKGATYEVRETDSTGYTVVLNEDEDADGIAEGTIVKDGTSNAAFTNLKLSALSFTKVAAEAHDTVLSGAQFQLFQLECNDTSHDHSDDLVYEADDCWKLVNTGESGTDGRVSFGNLTAGSEYRLVETKAPDGRVLPEGQWKVTTDATNLIEIAAVGARDGRLPLAFAVDEATGALLLPNARPMDIPSSGGFGEQPFLITGGLLMLTALGIILIKKPRGKRTASKEKQ